MTTGTIATTPRPRQGAVSPTAMRVVHYYPRASIGDGGASLAVRAWCRAQAGLGHHVSVACDPVGDRFASDVELVHLRHRRIGRVSVPFGTKQAFKDASVAVLHSGWLPSNAVVARALQRADVPYVVTPHGAYDRAVLGRHPTAKAAWLQLVDRRVLERAVAIHLFFEEERRFIESIGVPTPTIVAPNPIDVPTDFRWSGRGDYVLWMGRYDVEHKGLDSLLTAWSRIPARDRPRLRLHGPDFRGGRKTVLDMVTALELDDEVIVGESIRGLEKWRVLSEARAFAYPSRWDAHSVAMTEALLLGVPVITTSSTVLGPALAREGAAFVADGSPDDLRRAISIALSPMASTISANGRGLAERAFAPASCGESWTTQLQEAMAVARV